MSRQPQWQPVLYGRTRRADRWWRVRPYDVDVGWLNALMVAGTGGGDGLATGPRYLLARRGQIVLVGGAGRTALLSETMNSDGSRPLYCFVGWLSKDPGAAVPSLEDLEEQWLRWAAAVYEAWMPLDWDKHPTDLADAHEPPFSGPPWSGDEIVPPNTSSAGGYPVRPDKEDRPPGSRPKAIPPEERRDAWRHLYAASGDFVFVAGLPTSLPDPNGVLTHVAITGQVEEAVPQGPAPASNVDPVEVEPTPEPVHTAPSPVDSARTGRPPVEPVPIVPTPVPTAHPSPSRPPMPAQEDQRPSDQSHRGGMLRRAGQAIRNLAGPPESHPEDEVEEKSHRLSTEPRRPASGPAKDLDYWQREEGGHPPDTGGPPKRLPPDDR